MEMSDVILKKQLPCELLWLLGGRVRFVKSIWRWTWFKKVFKHVEARIAEGYVGFACWRLP